MELVNSEKAYCASHQNQKLKKIYKVYKSTFIYFKAKV